MARIKHIGVFVGLVFLMGTSVNIAFGAGVTDDPGRPSLNQVDTTLLHDNGPLVNSPGTGSGGADESVLQNTSLGMTALGFPGSLPLDFRLADDFAIATGGWIIDSVTFYLYQPGSTTTSTITSISLQIWDGPPGDPGSTVVFGDPTTNRLATSDWSGIFRVSETTLGTTTRPIMWAEATVGQYFPAGTYWLDWQADGSLGTGPYAPPITLNGQTTTGDALHGQTGVWNPALDGGTSAPQGFPFLITGSATHFPPVDIIGLPDPPIGTPCGLDTANGGLIFGTDIADDEIFNMMPTPPVATLGWGPIAIGANSGSPLGITSDLTTTVFVSDSSDDDVDFYDGQGNYLTSFSVVGQTTFPEGIAWHPDNTIWVIDGDSAHPDHALHYDLAGGFLGSHVLDSTSTDGMAWDYLRACFWVYDSDSDSVRQYTPDFQPMASFPGSIAAGGGRGEGVAVDGNTLYVMGVDDKVLVIFDISAAEASTHYIFGDSFGTGDTTGWDGSTPP